MDAEREAAARNRQRLTECGVTAVHLLGAPGSGRTTLIERTISDLGARRAISVVVADRRTSLDAERLRPTGTRVVPIRAPLDAVVLESALETLDPAPGSLVFAENVGALTNGHQLGETARVAMLSVADGADRPVKYPYVFATAHLVVIGKLDLLPYVDFDLDACRLHLASVNPAAEVIAVSARQGDNLTDWYGWLARLVA